MDLTLAFDQAGFKDAHTVSLHLRGYDVGHRKATEAFGHLMQVFARLQVEFQWGEHWFERSDESVECQYCGGEFSDFLADLGCSAVY